jgi:hypothetical protein
MSGRFPDISPFRQCRLKIIKHRDAERSRIAGSEIMGHRVSQACEEIGEVGLERARVISSKERHGYREVCCTSNYGDG